MARLQPGFKAGLILVGVIVAVFGLRTAMTHGWIPTPGIMKSMVPTKATLPDVKEAMVTNAPAPAPLPGDTVAKQLKQHVVNIRGEIWEWNAQANLIYANGGAETTQDSLMAKHDVYLSLIRQDDTVQMRNDLLACAKEHVENGAASCSTGADFVVVMGDGAGQFFAFLNPLLKKLGPEWQAKAIGATGYSRGEDAFMAPPEVKSNPQRARGLLVAGVLRDGDWNIALKWAGDNNIPNNPDEKTYDPDAINWLNTDDYLKATEAYNTGQCEDRKVVKDGHPTGETKHVCVDSVVTWTPGDVNEAHGKGGLIKVVSSKQYRSQMPATIIGPKAFFEKNRGEIEGMLAATFEAGDQMKAYDKALRKAAELSAVTYHDQDGSYWYKYFKGVTERDTQSVPVELGGSSVNNLADEKILFGLEGGTNDNFKSTYTVFKNIVEQQYPALFKDNPIPSASEIEDRSYVTGAEAVMGDMGSNAEQPNFSAESTGPAVSKRDYHINFDTGKATFTPDGVKTMTDIRDSVAITGLFIQIDGYTDNQGPDTVNEALSLARARAVKDWLQARNPKNFPNSRFRVSGHGSEDPVAPNTTEAGRAENRRVKISLLGGN